MKNQELTQLQQKREELLTLLKENELAFAGLSGDVQKDTFDLPKKIDADLIEHIEKFNEKRNSLIDSEISYSGFKDFDNIIGGFKKNDFVIIGARPGMGKTELMLNMLLNNISTSRKNVLYFSLEMNKTQTLNKLLSYEAEVPYAKINSGALKKSEWKSFEKNIETLKKLPLFIDDTASINLYDLIAKCKQMKQEHNVNLVYIDSLQLITLTEKERRKASSKNVLNVVSAALKDLIKTEDISIIATSQLSRSLETRGGAKRPQIMDLKGSGELEEIADTIIMLYRPEVYRITQDDDGLDTRGIAELIVAKNNFGKTSTFKIKYESWINKFSDLTQEDIDMQNRGWQSERPYDGYDYDDDDDEPF